MNEIEFLKARLNELESIAQNAIGLRWTDMTEETADGENIFYTVETRDEAGRVVDLFDTTWKGRATALYIARVDPAWTLANIATQRKIIEINEEWPILVESEPVFATDLASSAMSMSQQIAWMTNQKYREVFGEEPPTTPVIRALIQPFSGHPDFQEEWRS